MLFLTTNTDDEYEMEYSSHESIKKGSNIISTLGTILGIVLIIAAIVIACVDFQALWFVSLALIVVAVVNIILFSIISNVLYGFGDLIEYTKAISENVSKISKK